MRFANEIVPVSALAAHNDGPPDATLGVCQVQILSEVLVFAVERVYPLHSLAVGANTFGTRVKHRGKQCAELSIGTARIDVGDPIDEIEGERDAGRRCARH